MLVAAVRLLAPPASRVQLMMLVPLGKRRTWQTLASAAWVSAVSQPAPLKPPISITRARVQAAEALVPVTLAPVWATRCTSSRRKPLVVQLRRHSTTVTTPTQPAPAPVAPRVSRSWLAAMPPAKSPMTNGPLVTAT